MLYRYAVYPVAVYPVRERALRFEARRDRATTFIILVTEKNSVSRDTIGEYLECWLSDCLEPLVNSSKMAHSTFIRYKRIVENDISPVLGRKKLRDLSRAEVRALYSAKAKELSPRSIDYIHVTLQKALSQAMRDDLINRNVATGERPRSSRNREEIKALSSEQAKALLSAARDTRNEALYVVAVHTSLRQGELLGLKWTDVDLTGRRLSVRRSLKVTDHGLDFGPPKNKASRRPLMYLRWLSQTRAAPGSLREEAAVRSGSPGRNRSPSPSAIAPASRSQLPRL